MMTTPTAALAQTPPATIPAPVVSDRAPPPCPPPAPGTGLCLSVSDDAALTVTGEYRVRAELLDSVDFGVGGAPGSDSLAHRLLIGADLPRPGGARGGGRLSSYSFEATARWQATSRIELYASLLRAETAGGLRDAGGRPVNYALLQLTTRF